jgi:cytochrome P450
LNQTQIKTSTSAALLRHLCQFEDEFIAGLQLNTTQQAQWFKRPAYQAERTAAFNFFNAVLDKRRDGKRVDDSLDLILNRPVPDQFAPLSQSELIESIYLLSIAGVGNIANFLCALMWKVVNTSWHAKAQQELRGADLSTLEGMKGYPVLKALINETERLYPPAPVVPKRATRDISFLNHIIAKDTVVLHLHTLPHYDPQEYPAPFEFRPERWLTQNPNKTNAFGGGKHLCLGMGVTRAFLPLLTAMLLRDYTLETQGPPHNRTIDANFAQSPVTTAMPVTLQKK